MGRSLSFVMPGLDPGIHEAAPQGKPYGWNWWVFIMDRRIKSGDDGRGWDVSYLSSKLIPALQTALNVPPALLIEGVVYSGAG